ncbi:NACHT nucleoside triphosphatase [Penicillium italicum]|uniref:NACHT nucleoside triphosphatase n=1 Tax=Penicillium italicum TaxID=40296 RepID=A0A0A2L818_PENIT|nr:NACHT nucleoside triphosphatase [Penicillium italicum]
MGDPLSIASGVAGLLSLGIQVTKSLLDFYSAYKGQTPALAKIMLNLENLLGILRSLDDIRQSGKPGADALVLEIDKTAAGCREIIEELRDECQKFQNNPAPSLIDRGKQFGRRVTYPFRESTLKRLEEDIGEIRENLSLALNVLQLRNQTGLEDGIYELKILAEQTNTMLISSSIRGWLMAPDATIDHNVACEKRHRSTGLWLVNGQEFQNWLVERNSFLWINGFAGSGKSVLCSTAIERTFRERQHQSSIGIGFFYFSFRDESKKDSSGMLRALLLQLSAQLEGGEKDLQELHMLYKSGTPPVDALLNSLRQTICKFSDTYILLDALDESPRNDKREGVLAAVEKIRQWGLPTLHLLVTSRNEIDIRNSLGTSFGQDISMKNPETDLDIEKFISYQLRNDPKLQKWKSRHEEIQEKLTSKAQGVFRYVECQLLALKRVRIRNQLDECLRSLPRDLDETYDRILCSIDEDDIEEARLILTLLCVSNRPLTVKELTGALSIDVRATEWQLDREGRSFSQDDLLDICLGLIEIAVIEDYRKQTPIVRIAHFSVQEYLESDRIPQQCAARFAIQKEPAHTEMAQICLVYLLDPTLSNGKLDEAKLEVFPLAEFAAQQWFYFYNNSGKGKSDIEALILRLFKDQTWPFVTWVRLHNVDTPWNPIKDFEVLVEDIPSPLYFTAILGLEYTLSALIASLGEKTAIDAALNTQAGVFSNALQAAALGGHNNVVQTLLNHGADINAQGGRYGNALQAASSRGHEKIVQILLNHGAYINAQGGRYGNALQAASSRGHEKIMQILLNHGADINTQGGRFVNALQAASYRGHEKIMQILLNHGADINAQGGDYGNALQAASYSGHEKIVQILLNHGADINAQGDFLGNALQAASYGGNEKIVQILLNHGADINAQGGRFSNALQAASNRGYEKIIQVLLSHGAYINA